MPRYKVTRTEYWNVTDVYEVEVEAEDEDQAETLADLLFTEAKPRERKTIEELEDSEILVEEAS